MSDKKIKLLKPSPRQELPKKQEIFHEALNATVTSGQDNKSPRTLSESVQRKSNLSGILPRRKEQVNESAEHTFADQNEETCRH